MPAGLIFSSYVSYRLNSSSSLTSLTAPSRAQYAFGGFSEIHASDPSTATYASTVYGWRMLIGLCLIISTIHGNLLNTFAISTSLAAKLIIATRLDAKPERLVKPKAAAKREERPRSVEPKAVDRVVFQLVDGSASMRLKLTYVMKGDRKIPTINALARFSTLEEAEKFRRRLRLSGINASVASRGATGFEVVVPKDELEKLTPEEKEAIKQYLEHVAQTRDEEKKKTAEEVLRRFDFGAKVVNIGGVRLGLVFKADRPPRAEKYGDPQLIAEIKTALENRLREILSYEFERWKNHIKVREGGKRLIITHHLLKRLAQYPNTAKTLNEKT
jgi:hypothetical protein